MTIGHLLVTIATKTHRQTNVIFKYKKNKAMQLDLFMHAVWLSCE